MSVEVERLTAIVDVKLGTSLAALKQYDTAANAAARDRTSTISFETDDASLATVKAKAAAAGHINSTVSYKDLDKSSLNALQRKAEEAMRVQYRPPNIFEGGAPDAKPDRAAGRISDKWTRKQAETNRQRAMAQAQAEKARQEAEQALIQSRRDMLVSANPARVLAIMDRYARDWKRGIPKVGQDTRDQTVFKTVNAERIRLKTEVDPAYLAMAKAELKAAFRSEKVEIKPDFDLADMVWTMKNIPTEELGNTFQRWGRKAFASFQDGFGIAKGGGGKGDGKGPFSLDGLFGMMGGGGVGIGAAGPWGAAIAGVVGLATAVGTAFIQFKMFEYVVSLVPPALNAVGVAAVGAVAAFGPLVGLLASIPAIAAAGLAGLGSIALGLQGVSDGVAALQARKDATATAAGRRSQAIAMRAAARGVAEAEWNLAQATKAVTEARKEAAKNLRDYRIGYQEALLSERDAVDALKDAQKRLDEAQKRTGRGVDHYLEQTDEFTGKVFRVINNTIDARDEEDDATRAVERAQLDLVRAQNAVTDSREKLNKAEAQGIENSDLVKNALHAQKQAVDALKAAHESLTTTATQGIDAWQKAQNKLSPAGERFARFIFSKMIPAVINLQKTAQSGLLPGVQAGLEDVLRISPKINQIVFDMAKSAGSAFKATTQYLTTGKGWKDFKVILDGMNVSWRNVVSSLPDAVRGFMGITKGAMPTVVQMSEDLATNLERLGKWATSKKGQKSLSEFFTEGYRVAKKWGDIILAGIGALDSIGRNSKKSGDFLLNSVFNTLTGITTWFGKKENQESWSRFEDGGISALKTIGSVIKSLGGSLFRLMGDPKFASKFSELGQGLKKDVIPALERLVQTMVEDVDWPVVTKTIGGFTDGVRALTFALRALAAAGQVGVAPGNPLTGSGPIPAFITGQSTGGDFNSGFANGVGRLDAGLAVEAWVNGIIQKAKELFGIKSPSKVTYAMAEDWSRGWNKGLRSTFDSVWTTVTTWGKGIIDGAITGITSGWEGLKRAFSTPIDWVIKNVFGRLQTAFRGVVSGVKGVVSGAGEAWSGIKKAFSSPVISIAKSLVNPFLSSVRSILVSLGLKSKADDLKNLPTSYKMLKKGGYTGEGDPFSVAGVVHADEYVIRSQSRRKFEKEHPGALDQLNQSGELPGYATGGQVGRIIPNASQGFRHYVPGFLLAIKAWAAATGKTWHMTGNGGARSFAEQLKAWNLYKAGKGPKAANPYKGGPHMYPAKAMDLSPRPANYAAARALLSAYGLGLTVSGEPWHVGWRKGGSGGSGSGSGGSGSGGGGVVVNALSQIKAKIASLNKANKALLDDMESSSVWGAAVSKYKDQIFEAGVSGLSKYANGTKRARRGVALVGENGRELVSFGGGERVYNHQATERVFSNMDGGRALTKADLEQLVREILNKAKPNVTATFEGGETKRSKDFARDIAWELR